MSENRVLTLDEVLGLDEQRKVYVEDREWKSLCGVCHVEHNHHKDSSGIGPCLVDRNEYWPLDAEFKRLANGGEVRVWSLPQPPTPEELAANPWPEVEM